MPGSEALAALRAACPPLDLDPDPVWALGRLQGHGLEHRRQETVSEAQLAETHRVAKARERIGIIRIDLDIYQLKA